MIPDVVGVVTDRVVGVEEGLFGEPENMVVVSLVEDGSSFSARGDQVRQTELGEVLGYPCRLSSHMIGEFVDRVLPVEQGPDDPQSGGVGEQLERLDGPCHLVVAWPIYLRSHAYNARSAGTRIQDRTGWGRSDRPGGPDFFGTVSIPAFDVRVEGGGPVERRPAREET